MLRSVSLLCILIELLSSFRSFLCPEVQKHTSPQAKYQVCFCGCLSMIPRALWESHIGYCSCRLSESHIRVIKIWGKDVWMHNSSLRIVFRWVVLLCSSFRAETRFLLETLERESSFRFWFRPSCYYKFESPPLAPCWIGFPSAKQSFQTFLCLNSASSSPHL